jgi:hypothetical protein
MATRQDIKTRARSKQSRELTRILEEGVYTTTDPQGKLNVFRQYQRAGLIPKRFNDPGQLIGELHDLIVDQKLSKLEALKKLEVTLGRSFFNERGKIIGRKIRDALSPELQQAWDMANLGFTAKDLKKLEAYDWSQLQKQYQEVSRRLGHKVDIGHFTASARGAPQNVASGSAEIAGANQAAGRSAENPNRPITSYEGDNVGVAANKVSGMAETALSTFDLPTRGGLKGSPLNPWVSIALGTNLLGNSSRLIPQDTLEMLNWNFNEFERQGQNPVAMYDYIRSQGGDGINIDDMWNAGFDQRDLSEYHPDVQAKNGGPVTSTKPPEGSVLVPRKSNNLEFVSDGGSIKVGSKLRRATGSVLPFVGIGAGIIAAAQDAQAGDMKGAFGTVTDTAIGEVPVVGDVVQPDGLGDGTLDGYKNYLLQQQEAEKRRIRSEQAKKRGGNWSAKIGNLKIAVPEFGISESLGIN